MVKELETLLLIDGVMWNPDTRHIRCLTHIINLVVGAFISNLVDDDTMSFKSTLSKVRSIAKAIRGSTLMWEAFSECCKSYGLNPMTIPLDVAPRWNSQYAMLEQAVYLRRACHRLVDDFERSLGMFKLTDYEWELAEVLLVFLMPFRRCTKRFECGNTNPEIGKSVLDNANMSDYVFFAYDTMYNHIDDVKTALAEKTGIGSLQCAPHLVNALAAMEKTLQEYYTATKFPTIYGDAMILNPRCKLSIFETETWMDENADQYKGGCRRRFLYEYSGSATRTSSNAPPEHQQNKRSASNEDLEFQALLASHAAKRRQNEFDRYIEITNDTSITSSLSWWKANAVLYPDLSKMSRDVLATPASGCAVERVFSVSGRIATWQRNRLSAETISNLMTFKYGLKRTWAKPDSMAGEAEEFPVPEQLGMIPLEWEDKWWVEKVKRPVRQEILNMFPQAM